MLSEHSGELQQQGRQADEEHGRFNVFDGMIGEVLLPGANVGTEVAPEWQVREDVVDVELSLPRDLNGDSMVDREHTDGVKMRLISFKNPELPAEYHVSRFLDIPQLPIFDGA